MRNGFITSVFLVTTLLCSHFAYAVLIRVNDGVAVTDPASETTTIWNIRNGKLQGAFNVDVDGTLWDVAFIDGSFNSLFGAPDALALRTTTLANDLSEALLAHVFLDQPALGFYFDVDPGKTFGCTIDYICHVITPYGEVYEGTIPAHNAINQDVGYDGGSGEWRFDTSYDTGTGFDESVFVYADWTLKGVSTVPVPATITILALGLIGLASRRFKKQS